MNLNNELRARVALSTISEPGDAVTGGLLQLVGACETLHMISTREPLPNTIDPSDGELWRARLSPRLREADLERVVADTERRGLTLLTPDDPRWPAPLRQLGVASPITLWIAGSDNALASDSSLRDWHVAVLRVALFGVDLCHRVRSVLT